VAVALKPLALPLSIGALLTAPVAVSEGVLLARRQADPRPSPDANPNPQTQTPNPNPKPHPNPYPYPYPNPTPTPTPALACPSPRPRPEQLRYLCGVYVASVALLPPALLSIKRAGGPVVNVWWCFAAFQAGRAACFTAAIYGPPLWRRLRPEAQRVE